jgi:hypothetical protein
LAALIELFASVVARKGPEVADNAFLPVLDTAGTVPAETLSGRDTLRLIAGITIDCSFADEVENKRSDASSNAAHAFMS